MMFAMIWEIQTRVLSMLGQYLEMKKIPYPRRCRTGRPPTDTEQYECPESRCKPHGPVIRFPFKLKDRQPEHCGYPGFDLYCDDKRQTVLELPTSVGLVVNHISYASQKIRVSVQQGCYVTNLQHLNLSATPFSLHEHDFMNYSLFNCSSTIPDLRYYYGGEIACLSGLGYHVYALESSSYLSNYPTLVSCTSIYSYPISLPAPNYRFPQIPPYFGLFWANLLCGDCEAHGKQCRFKSNNNNNTTKPEIECFYMPKPTVLQNILFKIAGAMSGVVLLVLLLIVVYRVRSSDKLEKLSRVKIEMFLKDYTALKPIRYSYSDIKRITNQFKEKLGQGAYGTVFKGSLSDEILVAVKMLNNSQGNGDDFINEVGTMCRIHHVNVVRLVGYCADGTKRALVYDFLPNESLEKFIFSADDGNQRFALGWEKLQDIAIGIAKGIEYLHQGCDQRILHFDIKPHNILLDNNFNPKISDFGLAKLCSKDQSAVSMTAARGTMGYIAPEVLSRNFGNASHKSDVYSFGMLLLEMVGGRKNIDVTVDNTSQVYFPEWVYGHLSQGREVELRIQEDGDAHIAKKLTQVGLWCIQWYPVDRPSMKVALQMLEGQGNNLPNPPNPFSSAADQTRSV